MKRTHSLARSIAAGVLGTGLLACSLGSSPAISRENLASQIESGTAPLVLDVRSESEYRSGHVPGAVHIPFRSVGSRHTEIPFGKDQAIVVYCAHGPRAAWAARALRNAGYTNVVYLEGHRSSWEDAGLPRESVPAPDAE